MHCRLPTSQTTKPVKDGRNEKEDHRHNMQKSMPITTGGPNIGQLADIERRDRHSPAGPNTTDFRCFRFPGVLR